MKKLMNEPLKIVREMLEGSVDMAPGQALLAGDNVVLQADLPNVSQRLVAVISGGGSGHEPAHAGYVGRGMLTAAVAGDVFTSPSVDAILAGIKVVSGPAGAVLIVKNYTGDRLNFALAAELAIQAGIPTEIVVVADDVALHSLVAPELRRGIAGTVLVHKIAGAAAANGLPLKQVTELARKASAGIGSMGVALGACTLPAAGKPGFVLGDTEIELGLGIHGEKGVSRSVMQSADCLVDIILETICADLQMKSGEHVALLVNGLGGTPPMELSIVARHALSVLRARGLLVQRAWVGNYMTALEMPGCSLSVMRLDHAMLDLLDVPTEAPAWTSSGRIRSQRLIIEGPGKQQTTFENQPIGPLAITMKRALFNVAERLEQAESHLTDLDSQAGDGDLGASMARGAQAIRQLPDYAWATPEILMIELGNALRQAIAGSSGPFYATALMRAGRSLKELSSPSVAQWELAFREAVLSVSEIGGAKAGDRTMMDALLPALSAFELSHSQGKDLEQCWQAAVIAAEHGAQATISMSPKLGRAAYLGDRVLGVPDGGAVAVSFWMKALQSHYYGEVVKNK